MKITEKSRMDYLVGEVRINWPYRTRTHSEGWTLHFSFRNRHGLRSAIDAAIRAERKAKRGRMA